MKKFTLSMIALIAMSTSAMAETMPAYGSDSYKSKHDRTSYSQDDMTNSSYINGFYLGGGIASLRIGADNVLNTDVDARASVYGLNLLGGIEVNSYFAVEGRIALNLQDWGEEENDTTSYSLFIKPMYPVNTAFSIYGLLGLGNVKIDGDGYSDSDTGFQWGLGSSVVVNDRASVFIDYTQLWNDDQFDGEDLGSENLIVDVITVGFIYKF